MSKECGPISSVTLFLCVLIATLSEALLLKVTGLSHIGSMLLVIVSGSSALLFFALFLVDGLRRRGWHAEGFFRAP